MWNECNCTVVWAFFGIAFFGTGIKTNLFQSRGHCWVFQICWHIECHALTASSFRIWNSSAVIPSPLLALFIVMLPKAHLTSLSRMSCSRWVTAPSWLSGSWRTFFYSSAVYSYHLFLIAFASVKSLPFLSFIVFAWNVPLVSPIFLKRSLVFPILLFSFISLHCSFKKAFLTLLAVLWNSAFSWVYLSLSPLPFASLLFSAICKASSDNQFALSHFFFFGWFWSPSPVLCYKSPSIVLQALCLPDLIRWIYLSPLLCNHKGFDLCHTGMLWDSLVAQMVKNLPAMQETWVPSLGQEDALEKEMATHSGTLAWKIPWTEEPGGLQSIGSQRVGHDWVASFSHAYLSGLVVFPIVFNLSLNKGENKHFQILPELLFSLTRACPRG